MPNASPNDRSHVRNLTCAGTVRADSPSARTSRSPRPHIGPVQCRGERRAAPARGPAHGPPPAQNPHGHTPTHPPIRPARNTHGRDGTHGEGQVAPSAPSQAHAVPEPLALLQPLPAPTPPARPRHQVSQTAQAQIPHQTRQQDHRPSAEPARQPCTTASAPAPGTTRCPTDKGGWLRIPTAPHSRTRYPTTRTS